MAMLADGGYQVGELAKLYYPDGIEVESINHDQAEALTLELLQRDKVVLFEPAIRFGDLFARVDILVKDGNDFQLIEVKAKSYNSQAPEILGAKGGILSGMRSYIEDVAFQAYVFLSLFPDARLRTYLMMPDKSVQVSQSGLNQFFKIVRDGKRSKVITSPDVHQTFIDKNILALVPIDEFVDIVKSEGVQYCGISEKLPVLAERWAAAYKADTKIKPIPGGFCGKCEFKSIPGDGLQNGFRECWTDTFNLTDEEFAKGTVLDVYNFRRKDRLIQISRVVIDNIQDDDVDVVDGGERLSLSERQWMQIRGIPKDEDRGGYWVAVTLMRREMNDWKFPYHFIDFETSTVAIPFHAEMRPYEPVAFQFSHHLMHEDGRIEHVGEFLLTDPVVFPNFKFAEALKAELEHDNGTVFMWSHHENTILNKIADQLEGAANPPSNALDLIAFIRSLVTGGDRQIYDLCKLSKDAYFHVGTKGSSSIKKVLPAVLNTSLGLKVKYSQPIYGSSLGIPSKNFRNFTWWVDSGTGIPIEPYDLLKDYGAVLLGEELDDPDELVIAEGGAAATAYARLQFEDLNPESRQKIIEALLRYCELDTLAMVMIIEAWKEFIQL